MHKYVSISLEKVASVIAYIHSSAMYEILPLEQKVILFSFM
jgi:hypothetical protein